MPGLETYLRLANQRLTPTSGVDTYFAEMVVSSNLNIALNIFKAHRVTYCIKTILPTKAQQFLFIRVHFHIFLHNSDTRSCQPVSATSHDEKCV